MPVGGKPYGAMSVGDSVATTLKRKPARRVSYDNTRRTPRKSGPTGSYGKFAHVKPVPNPIP